MHIFHNLKEWLIFRSSLSPNLSMGFIPTMGNLHAGHGSLYDISTRENDLTVASLFINPTQFNRSDDFNNYPKTPDADLMFLKNLNVDYCLLPNEQEIYPDQYNFQVHENKLSKLMEGQHRPGHFNGVLTIVMKLLNLVKPTTAYFGEKDYQQYLLISEMAKAFFLNINIQPCPTIRESSGLAYSSRNNRLTVSQRKLADNFARIFHQQKSCQSITTELEETGIIVEYITDYEGRRFAAVSIGDIRLIDNYSLAK